MKKALLLMLLTVMSGNAAAAWVEACSNETATIYIDPGSIRKSGDVAQMSNLLDLKSGVVLGELVAFTSYKEHQEFDCKKRQARILYVSWYAENMGSGRMVGSDSAPTNWRPVRPGSMCEVLLDLACGK